jgi:hypothetical protein
MAIEPNNQHADTEAPPAGITGGDYVLLSPRQRWGTCCPHDPECEHSFLDDTELSRWMDTPICDGEAEAWEERTDGENA